ncbi:MAG: sigma-70 family RNA polymerase sigma factor, partial [Planctomycetota bacterium]
MNGDTDAVDIERLLAEQRWLARLAQRLVGDADLAADLTQTTLARALERPPSGERSIRGWLATVLRRETARHLRRDAERPGREGTAANDALAPATDALVERVATQRELARLVLELPTAQREVLLLSFWEGLPPRAVARRLGLELESVKSRKKRALARLRERLDSEYGGDRGAWMAALAPLAWPHEVALAPLAERTSNGTPGAFPTTSATLGTALMSSTLIKIALSASLVAGTAWLVLGPGSGESGPARPAPPGVASTTTHDDLQGVEPEASRRDHDAQTAVRREALAAPGPSSESTAEPLGTLPVGTTPLSGIAVDPVGAPLDGLRVRANGEGARTDRQGRFALASASDGPVELDEAGWTTVFAARRAPSSSIAPAMLIGAPEAVFEGQVVDARSNPVPNAWVEYLLTDAARLTIEADLDHTEERRWSTEAGPDGTFRLTAPGMEGGVLRAVADGHPSRVVDAPTRSAGGLTIRLANPQDARRYLAGRVVDASGLPVPGARVTHGLEVVTCDGDGRFELDLRDPEGLNVAWGERTGDDAAPTEISAFAFGFLPGSMRAELDADGEPGWPAEVV